MEKQEAERQRITAKRTLHTHLVRLLEALHKLNPPADKLDVNWMARGQIQQINLVEQKMVIQFQLLRNLNQECYECWTYDSCLQLQLLSAYLCDYLVDLFSAVPAAPCTGTFNDGGEILTIHVVQITNQTSPPDADTGAP